ncbi:MAG: CoA ester lyase [Hyphomonadaceae bacterium]|nr:CoA ester lyase [Hyphomonadaceae bacterium]
MNRSWLFVPGDSEKKIAKGFASAADAIILDLEDAVAPDRKIGARALVADTLKQARRKAQQIWVRVNSGLESCLGDLAAIASGRPDGIVLPKVDGPADVLRVGHYLDALEAREGLTHGAIGILPVATETPRAPFALGDFADANLSRLVGLTWGAEDLGAALGASGNRDDDGAWSFTFRWVRSATLLAAKAAGVQAVETLHADFRDAEGLMRTSRQAAREGFTGRIAIHPDQVAVINAAFRPSAEEVAFATRVVAAFAAEPGAGTIAIEGKMLDIPHLTQAKNILALGAKFPREVP